MLENAVKSKVNKMFYDSSVHEMLQHLILVLKLGLDYYLDIKVMFLFSINIM